VSGFSRTVEVFMLTRREFGKLALSGLVVARTEVRALPFGAEAAVPSTINGVTLGAQTYSFRDLPRAAGSDLIDPIIKAMTECGLGECELFAPHVEPQFPSGERGAPGAPPSPQAVKARDELRKWRLTTPLDHFRAVRKKFDAAGITVYAYNYSPNASFTDEEIDRGFEITKALGAGIITASTTLEVAKRIVPFAEKHKMVVAMHNHSRIDDPNEFATPASFAAAMKMSKYFKVNLDIGHFTAANFDPLAYLRQHHASITNLHLKDRRKNQGDNTPWGQGDTPIREALQLLKRERWPIRAYVEYEYRGAGTPVEEVKKCFAYAKQALA
jgi:sugar phosphate isomerase/epimerase